MRFIRDALITIAVLLAIVSVALYTQVRAGGLAADAEPGHAERLIASRLVRLAIPADAKQQQNPLGADKTVWRTAADHYGDHCAACHGNDGRGDTQLGRNMYPGVPSFADETVQRLATGSCSTSSRTVSDGQACPRGRMSTLQKTRGGSSP